MPWPSFVSRVVFRGSALRCDPGYFLATLQVAQPTRLFCKLFLIVAGTACRAPYFFEARCFRCASWRVTVSGNAEYADRATTTEAP